MQIDQCIILYTSRFDPSKVMVEALNLWTFPCIYVKYLVMFHSAEMLELFQADVDNSGTIDYGEFVAATVHLNKLEREEHLVAAFQYFDKDGSGYITVDELQQACIEHNMTDVFLEDIIREVDQDNVSNL